MFQLTAQLNQRKMWRLYILMEIWCQRVIRDSWCILSCWAECLYVYWCVLTSGWQPWSLLSDEESIFFSKPCNSTDNFSNTVWLRPLHMLLSRHMFPHSTGLQHLPCRKHSMPLSHFELAGIQKAYGDILTPLGTHLSHLFDSEKSPNQTKKSPCWL